jgi:hypothetical protein
MSATAELAYFSAPLALTGSASEPLTEAAPVLLSACKAAYVELRQLNLDDDLCRVVTQLRSAILSVDPDWKP